MFPFYTYVVTLMILLMLNYSPSLVFSSFAEKVKAAAAEGKVLRYAASVKPPSASNPKGSLTVGLLTVGSGTPLGTLSGSDNLVEIYTKWYDPNPLVVRGAGAGTGTTAAGVLSDMIELAFTRD